MYRGQVFYFYLLLGWLVCSFASHLNSFLIVGEFSTTRVLEGGGSCLPSQNGKAQIFAFAAPPPPLTARACTCDVGLINQVRSPRTQNETLVLQRSRDSGEFTSAVVAAVAVTQDSGQQCQQSKWQLLGPVFRARAEVTVVSLLNWFYSMIWVEVVPALAPFVSANFFNSFIEI